MKEIDVGQIIGEKYTLVRLLGIGAMGQVWAARHQGLQQMFAVKLMRASESFVPESAETSLRRFENEAQIAAALSRKSRHITQVTDYGMDDGTAYLVMELLEGEGLDKRAGDGRTLEPGEVSAVIGQIAKGLTVAHCEGVTHRDLKPANVFLARGEDDELLVKLLDFGIARLARRIVATARTGAPTKLTMKGLVLGSPGYMSPEQAMAESPDARADVWSLAVVAYEALAGATPFRAKTSDAMIVRICNCQATPLRELMPTASEELANIFARAFSSDIAKRFQTAAGFADALAAALPAPSFRLSARANATETARATPADDGVSLKIAFRPRKILPALATGLAIGIVIAAAIFLPRIVSTKTPATTSASATPIVASIASTSAPPTTASVVAPSIDVSALPTASTTPKHPTIAAPSATARTSPSVSAAPLASTPVDRSAIF